VTAPRRAADGRSAEDPQGHHRGHAHDHPHDHDHPHGHGHDHPHHHDHPHGGIRGFITHLFVPHTHDAADSIDEAMEASSAGIRALKVSLFLLLATTVLQAAVVAISGSVALLADTVHNFSDALTAVPLWVAFVLGRRAASRRYTYGLGRAEDLAGLFIVFVVLLSAVVAAWQSIDRMIHPQPLENIGWVIAAGLIGFAGNEVVAVYRIRVGRRIGSAALVADGVHARTDGFTSLAVVIGGLGVLAGFPLADPLVGLAISAAIVVLLWGTVRSVGRRLLDGIEPELVDSLHRAVGETPGVRGVARVQLRWVGHRLQGAVRLETDAASLADAQAIAGHARERARTTLRSLDDLQVEMVTPVVTTAAGHVHEESS